MANTGGRAFATRKRKLFAMRQRRSQEVEIVAAHQFVTGARQANGAIAQLMGFPGGTSGDARETKQALCDGTIAFTRQAAVERAQCEAKPLASLPRQAMRWACAFAAGRDPPQMQCGRRAHPEILVEWDDHRGWCRGARTVDEHGG